MTALKVRVKLNTEVTCPSCWHVFPPYRLNWVSAHPELEGDPKLGEHAQSRFLPTRFDIKGRAIDVMGNTCEEMACVKCHLPIPRPSVEQRPLFVSIVGTPSCGKSYFLTSMAWQIRRSLPSDFKVGIRDADPIFNQILNHQEEQQFFNSDQNALVRLGKTEEHGDHYATSTIDGKLVQLPRPILFSMEPLDSHPNSHRQKELARLLHLYDNAGESFMPGRDNAASPVTRHLLHAMGVFYCFDPTQDTRMRTMLDGKTDDTQVTEQSVTARQELILHEMVQRFRRLRGMELSEKTTCPLIVIVTKCDCWKALLPEVQLSRPIKTRKDGLSAIDLNQVRSVSQQVRELMLRVSPELVTSAESFSRHVWFIPVSATGKSPEVDSETGVTGVRPRDMDPIWCDVPLLVALAQHGHGLVPFVGSP